MQLLVRSCLRQGAVVIENFNVVDHLDLQLAYLLLLLQAHRLEVTLGVSPEAPIAGTLFAVFFLEVQLCQNVGEPAFDLTAALLALVKQIAVLRVGRTVLAASRRRQQSLLADCRRQSLLGSLVNGRLDECLRVALFDFSDHSWLAKSARCWR